MARTQTTSTPQTVREYQVIAFFPESSCEEYRFYLATSLAEALTMAERDDATRPPSKPLFTDCDECRHHPTWLTRQRTLGRAFTPTWRTACNRHAPHNHTFHYTVLLTDDPLYGITPEDYAVAEAEGIAFNRADGLLL